MWIRLCSALSLVFLLSACAVVHSADGGGRIVRPE